jgi:hypothetical protein
VPLHPRRETVRRSDAITVDEIDLTPAPPRILPMMSSARLARRARA